MQLFYSNVLMKIDEEAIRQVGEKRQMVLDQAKANIIKAQLKQKETYNKKHSCTETYKIGAIVLKKYFLRKKEKVESWIRNGWVHLQLWVHLVVDFTVFKKLIAMKLFLV